MKQMKVKWKKISPADLSSTCCAQYFAFSKNNRFFSFNEVEKGCLFTKIIMTAANLSYSLYDVDIWVGFANCQSENKALKMDSDDMLGILEWSVKMNPEAFQTTTAAELLSVSA